VRDFSLVETMLWRTDGGYFLLKEHAERLARSAVYFSFAFDEEKFFSSTAQAVSCFSGNTRVRVLSGRNGEIDIESRPMPQTGPMKVCLADKAVDSSNVFLYHKTTNRSVYSDAVKDGYDDVLLFNERGELTESTIANVVLEIDGRKLTPHRDSGLLDGVYRRHLLEKCEISEAVLKVDDLGRAGKVWLINSVRGWMEVHIAK
jgi:para-aminobenzoate synthetase / 4-amino-4-deoxychorismate lyase